MSDEQIKEIFKLKGEGLSYRQIAIKMDINKSVVAFYLNEKRNRSALLFNEKKQEYQKQYEELVCSLAKECTNFTQLCTLLNKRPTNTTRGGLKLILEKHNIDISHFVEDKAPPQQRPKMTLNEVFTENAPFWMGSKLKSIILTNNLKPYKCEVYNNEEWNGQPIPLQVHHLNGNHNDNRFENLQLICPNCHAQTHNYNGRNKKTTIADKMQETFSTICKNCGKEYTTIDPRHLFCSIECEKRYQEELDNKRYLPKEEIEELYVRLGSSKLVAKECNMDEKTFSRYRVQIGLPKKCKELREYIQNKYGPQEHWKEIMGFRADKIRAAQEAQEKQVDVYTPDMEYIETVKSIAETSRKYNVEAKTIGRICQGYGSKYKDHIFKFHKN